MDGPDQGPTLTAREAAQALGVTERTIYSYVERGLLAAEERRVGLMRRLRFTSAAVEACRERLTQGQQEP